VEARQGGKLEPAQRSRAFLLFKWLDDLIRDPRVLDPVEQLIGPDILCWSTIFWIKDSGSKSFVGWHQDNTYWGLSSRNVITAWFAISDASVEAGCMKVMPGTHQGETLRHEDTYHQDNMLTRGQVIPGLDESRAVYMPLRAGEMSYTTIAWRMGPGRTFLRIAASACRCTSCRRGPNRWLEPGIALRWCAGKIGSGILLWRRSQQGFRSRGRRVSCAGGEGDAGCVVCGGGEEVGEVVRVGGVRPCPSRLNHWLDSRGGFPACLS
jgi:hypothetical protein